MLENLQCPTTHPTNSRETALDDVQRKTVERVAAANLPTKFGEFRIVSYRSLISSEEFIVLTRGSLRAEKPTLARIHSQCMTGDVFGSIKCDCGQ